LPRVHRGPRPQITSRDVVTWAGPKRRGVAGMGWETSDRREHLPSDWRELRQKRFEIDGFRCTYENVYGERCPAPAEECDHIGNRNDHRIAMLRSLCKFHHGQKTSAQGALAAAAERRRHNSRFRREERHPGLL
jgi:5-methylcytosine-specific restriction protein A